MSGISFSSTFNPARIVFGPGKLALLPEELSLLGASRTMVLATPFQRSEAEALAERLGDLAAGVFAEAAMHTPVSVTERALAACDAAEADSVASFGGGSTIGLGKAVSWRKGLPHIAIATTYAGSEVTPILGETKDGLKSTMRDRRILPDTVIYDPDLTLSLSVAASVNSGLNAMAHAVEGLFSRDRNPVLSWQATEGIRALKEALPQIVEKPDDVDARSLALYGSWLCGTVLGAAGMALHHKICHVLGGTFDLPHAETHAILLPHTARYNAEAAADMFRPLQDLFGASIGAGLFDFSAFLGAPVALRDLGLAESDLDRATDIAMESPYWNPRPIERPSIRALLQSAWEGSRPP